MLVTIIWEWNRKELLYWVHELVWNPPIYDVSEDQIKLIKECTTDRIQEVIDHIILTSPIWKLSTTCTHLGE